MPNAGAVVIEIRPGSSSRQPLMKRWRSDSSVVQAWPVGGTYCRSSSQIGQAAGGLSDGSYWVPQVLQMKAGMGTECNRRFENANPAVMAGASRETPISSGRNGICHADRGGVAF